MCGNWIKHDLSFFRSDSSSDDEDYWFQNADPKRPKITQPPVKHQPKRIFHKLEPQTRPKIEDLDPQQPNSIQGRVLTLTEMGPSGLKFLAINTKVWPFWHIKFGYFLITNSGHSGL